MFDVITIGAATRDVTIESSKFKLVHAKSKLVSDFECVPFGSKMDISDIHFTTGGAATNTAVTFARQGFRTSVVARVGDDLDGTEVRRALMREGIDVSRIIVDRKGKTAHGIVLLHASGERSILVYRGASAHWDIKDLHKKPLDAKWFYVSSVGGDFTLLEEIMTIARKHNVRVAYNPGGEEIKYPHKLVPLLYGVDILIMNREEGATFTGASFENEQEIFKRIDDIEPGICVLTDGARGVWVSDGSRIYKAGKFAEKSVVDRTGAGDAFGSGFVAGVMRRLEEKSKGAENPATIRDLRADDISYAIRLGSANATAKVEGVGAKYGILTKHDFDTAIRWKGIDLHVQTSAH